MVCLFAHKNEREFSCCIKCHTSVVVVVVVVVAVVVVVVVVVVKMTTITSSISMFDNIEINFIRHINI